MLYNKVQYAIASSLFHTQKKKDVCFTHRISHGRDARYFFCVGAEIFPDLRICDPIAIFVHCNYSPFSVCIYQETFFEKEKDFASARAKHRIPATH